MHKLFSQEHRPDPHTQVPSHLPCVICTLERSVLWPHIFNLSGPPRPHLQPVSLRMLPLPPNNLVSYNRPLPESRPPAPHNSSQSALQLLMDMDHQSPVHGRSTFASIQDVVTPFGSLELSDLETLGNVQCSLTSSVPTTDVVYLSDDD
ncbi:unnamed protein product [Fraxinus pennsylvanica]|uniref:Uncharacterized protein n=1 Tax=Fraxinus pennsylvanica TaxID=56036 RepID=A0AAD1ZFT5_9LAMI|nr:unnamed protein product [Fraxinus pennsylvanica]